MKAKVPSLKFVLPRFAKIIASKSGESGIIGYRVVRGSMMTSSVIELWQGGPSFSSFNNN